MRRALLIGSLMLAISSALAQSVVNNDLSTGRRIFDRGGAANELTATFAGTNAPLPPNVRRCSACHGRDGRGAQEGGVEIPPVSWAALAAPRDRSAARPGRPAYDEATLRRALAEGIDPAGRSLAAGMPRFRLTATQAAWLFDYLRILGIERDLDPGVAPDEIRVGAVLPLSGAQAESGRAMRTGLENALAAAGPIYGRRLRLVTEDAGDDVAVALRRLVASDQVLALVATLLPARLEAIEGAEDIPVIGPLVPTPVRPVAGQFYLLASIEDQMRVLVDELAAETPHPLRLRIIGPEGSVADAVRDQVTRNRGTVVGRSDVEDPGAVLPSATEPAADAILVLPGVSLDRLVAQHAGQSGDGPLAGPAEAVTLSAATDARLRLVLPVWPAELQGRASSATIPPLAAAAVAVLVEGLKRAGAHASRAGLVSAIETLRDFPIGVLPPVSFGRSQHAGNHASVVVRPDRSSGIVMIGGWRTPR